MPDPFQRYSFRSAGHHPGADQTNIAATIERRLIRSCRITADKYRAIRSAIKDKPMASAGKYFKPQKNRKAMIDTTKPRRTCNLSAVCDHTGLRQQYKLPARTIVIGLRRTWRCRRRSAVPVPSWQHLPE